MSQKQINLMADEWLSGDQSKRTSIQDKLKGSAGLNALLNAISAKLSAQA
jgi:hypothetical protein